MSSRRKKIQKGLENRNQMYLERAGEAVDEVMNFFDILKSKKKKKKKPSKKRNSNSPLGKAASSIRKETNKYRD